MGGPSPYAGRGPGGRGTSHYRLRRRWWELLSSSPRGPFLSLPLCMHWLKVSTIITKTSNELLLLLSHCCRVYIFTTITTTTRQSSCLPLLLMTIWYSMLPLPLPLPLSPLLAQHHHQHLTHSMVLYLLWIGIAGVICLRVSGGSVRLRSADSLHHPRHVAIHYNTSYFYYMHKLIKRNCWEVSAIFLAAFCQAAYIHTYTFIQPQFCHLLFNVVIDVYITNIITELHHHVLTISMYGYQVHINN